MEEGLDLRGQILRKMTYKELTKYETEDQITEAARSICLISMQVALGFGDGVMVHMSTNCILKGTMSLPWP